MNKLLVPLLAGAALLGGCTTMNDPLGELGGIFNGRAGGPAPVRDPYPSQPGQPGPAGGTASYHAVGQEPGWTLDIDPRAIRFSGPYGQGPVSEPTPRPINGFAGEIYRTARLDVNIVHGQCRDAMSGRRYPDKVQLRVDGRGFEGCGGPSDQSTSDGPPVPSAAGPLADSHWRVISVNGRPVPLRGDYHVDFTADRLSAKFGCNGMGARYAVDRDMLSTDGLMQTTAACAPLVMSFESQGSGVLRSPARVRWSPGRLTLTNNAGIIELERR